MCIFKDDSTEEKKNLRKHINITCQSTFYGSHLINLLVVAKFKRTQCKKKKKYKNKTELLNQPEQQ